MELRGQRVPYRNLLTSTDFGGVGVVLIGVCSGVVVVFVGEGVVLRVVGTGVVVVVVGTGVVVVVVGTGVVDVDNDTRHISATLAGFSLKKPGVFTLFHFAVDI